MKFANLAGISVIFVPLFDDMSTTKILQKGG